MVVTEGGNDHDKTIAFNPPLYVQRYFKVFEILSRKKPKKVVDFGCAECKFLKLLSKYEYVEELCGVDIHQPTLKQCEEKLQPLAWDYLDPRSAPLTIRLMQGSVLEADRKLKHYNAVTCIELIEHLMPEDLQAFCANVFGFIQPILVIVSTPNADFNELFLGKEKAFRHYDHKFEWSRQQFQSWCKDVCDMYRYDVEYDGVGKGPVGSEHLGFCSQIAVFSRIEPISVVGKILENEVYQLVKEIQYPYKTMKEKEKDAFVANLQNGIDKIICLCTTAAERMFCYHMFPQNRTILSPFKNYNCMFQRTEFPVEPGQFDNAEEDNVDVENNKCNTYGQEIYSVKSVPLSIGRTFLQHISENIMGEYLSALPVKGQFDNIESEKISHNEISYLIELSTNHFGGNLAVNLSECNLQMPFTLQFTREDVDCQSLLHKPFVLFANETSLRIPIECLLKLNEAKELNVLEIIEILKQQNNLNIKLCKDSKKGIIVDIIGLGDGDERSLSEVSSSEEEWFSDNENDCVLESFHKENWDSD